MTTVMVVVVRKVRHLDRGGRFEVKRVDNPKASA